MRVVEEIINEYRIKKYGELALDLKTSHLMLIGGRAEDGIKIEKLLIASKGNFYRYQEIIQEKLLEDYNVDFLDFSLIMGKFLGIYNLYCYIDINKEIRKKIINNKLITKKNVQNIITNNVRDIFTYLASKFNITFNDFKKFLASIYIIHDDYSLYNYPLFFELAYILMGNYLFLEFNTLSNGFIGCEDSIDFFHKMNKSYNFVRKV